LKLVGNTPEKILRGFRPRVADLSACGECLLERSTGVVPLVASAERLAEDVACLRSAPCKSTTLGRSAIECFSSRLLGGYRVLALEEAIGLLAKKLNMIEPESVLAGHVQALFQSSLGGLECPCDSGESCTHQVVLAEMLDGPRV
jgi:hypothetical protein